MKLVSDLYNKAASFTKDEKGTILPTAVILISTLVLAAGAAVDFTRFVNARAVMITALDAAVLDAGVRLGAGQPVDQQFEDDFNAFFELNITGRGNIAKDYTVVSFEADGDTGEVNAVAEVNLDTTLMRVAGVDELTATSASGGIFQQVDTEVTIMLDSTGSMNTRLEGTSTTRLEALQSAASDAVDILLPDGANTRNLRIGLVPYGSSINVGQRLAQLATAGNQEQAVASTQNFIFPQNNVETFNGCVTERGGREAATDAFYTAAPVGSDRRSVEGRVTRNRETCPDLEIRPLTNNANQLKQDISNLQADGFTGGHLGVAWSYYMLSENWARAWPNNAAEAYSNQINKVAILMTDGDFNTAYDGVSTAERPFLDQPGKSSNLATDLCADMKAAKNGNPGIIVYSIAFAAPAAAEETLRTCANADDNGSTFFFSASSEEELREAFRSIASDITSLRLTQ